MRKFFIVVLFCIMVCCLSACGTCNENISVSGVSFNENALELYIGDEYKLEYVISPEDATDISVLFYSSDESVATVQTDGTVYAVSQGLASVIVMTEDGNYFDICYVTVFEEEVQTQDSGQTDSGNVQTDEQTENQEQEGEKDLPDEDNTENQNDGQDEEQDEDDETGDNEEGENKDEGNTPGIVTYTVTFIADGITVDVVEFTGDNLSVEEPEVPEKDGYTGKWEEYTLSLENITVNAVYTAIEYTATFMFNDIVYDTILFTIEDTEIKEPEVTISAGYEVEWESYVLGCEDITINAVITVIEYTITYENTKGAENSNSGTYSAENRFRLENLSLTGYEFEGWYIDGERVYSVNYLYGNLTITAQWKVLEYEIKFFDEYGNVEIATRTYTAENTDIDIPEIPDNIPDKEGYIKKWEYFELTYDSEPIYVHVVYVKIDE